MSDEATFCRVVYCGNCGRWVGVAVEGSLNSGTWWQLGERMSVAQFKALGRGCNGRRRCLPKQASFTRDGAA